jgi:uncharacterized protein YabN with tetrapyrrole methylase and pyrophosphatase domain
MEGLQMEHEKSGSIICLGIGITLGSHLSLLAKNYIEQADVVFSLVSDGIVEQWINGMNNDSRSLQAYYKEGISRAISYRNMIEAILAEVYQGKNVVGAFYGHPGVFACVPHLAIAEAKQQGYFALMEPGISAEDCLFSDLGIDPGEYGCAQFEASQFMMFQRTIDPSAYLILWQVCIAGDTSLTKFSTCKNYRAVLTEVLLKNYEGNHRVILYEAPTLPIHSARKQYIKLSDLSEAELNPETTLVIPPSEKMKCNTLILEKLAALGENKTLYLCN